MVNVFAVPVFFICFRECLETSIVVSVLLAFLKQTIGPDQDAKTYKRLVRQVWCGIASGLLICLVIGGAFIGVFYTLGVDHFANTEDIWEGAFALLAAIIISAMGAALLRVSKLQDKWRVKLAKALEATHIRKGSARGMLRQWTEKYAMFLLPFITTLREGLEAVVFIGGVGLGMPATSFPLAVATGLAAGIIVGYLIYKGQAVAPLQIFLIVSTCFLYLVAAGLFSRSVWYFETNAWNKVVGGDASEVGSGPGSYDIRQSVWHVNCCNAELNGGGGWGIFNAILGWQNSATYGSVLSYNLYWIAVIIAFVVMRFNEKNGHWPLMKPRNSGVADEDGGDSSSGAGVMVTDEKIGKSVNEVHASTNIREIEV
ncbi:MAG: hypothetical protein M1822_009214 [Bathelium mastoideum]|nr:MAG: hypothetical protein M1822_009214 [Bathelium mastoideum]